MIEYNVHFPTCIGLLSDCVKNLNRAVKKVRRIDKESTTSYHNKLRTVKNKVYQLVRFVGVEAMKQLRK